MKKYYVYLFALLAVSLLASCNKSDEPENKQIVNMTINCRAINGDQFLFSQGNAMVELNYTDMMIKFTADYKDADGVSHTITTPDMKLTATGSSMVYEFVASPSQQGVGGFGSAGVAGYIDMSTGMTWFTINNGTSEVVCTTQLLYAYSTTEMTNPENDNHGSHRQSAYLFALDSRGETCVLRISNFISNMNGAVDAPEVQYNGLSVTPTVTGYKITADEAESNYTGFYKLTDVDFTLDNQCMVINGTFKCNGLVYQVSGGLFSAEIIN